MWLVRILHVNIHTTEKLKNYNKKETLEKKVKQKQESLSKNLFNHWDCAHFKNKKILEIKDFRDFGQGCLIGGVPAKIVARDYKRIFCDENVIDRRFGEDKDYIVSNEL